MKNYIYSFLLLLVMASCGQERVDTAKVKKEMEKYKIKKIMPGEILSKGEELGDSIINLAQNSMTLRIDSALAAGDVAKALPFCILSNNPQIASIENQFETRLSRAGFPHLLRNPNNGPDSNQALILEGYSYAINRGLTLKNDVFDNKNQIIVNAPILMKKSCLPCHGKIYQDITESNYQLISAKYPKDNSTGFKINDPMGLWTVILDKSFVIRNMDSDNK